MSDASINACYLVLSVCFCVICKLYFSVQNIISCPKVWAIMQMIFGCHTNKMIHAVSA